MTNQYSRIIRALQAETWALQPEKLEALCEIVALRVAGGRFTAEEIEARTGSASRAAQPSQPTGAVGVLPIRGVISHRAGMVGNVSEPRGANVESLTKDFRTLLDDRMVEAIVLDVDSPGGSVAGIEELASEIYRARGSKPIIASVNALAASGAYWLASAADEIVVTPSGQVGSIGVYTVHHDYSAAMEAEGVKATIVRAGKYKIEANPYEPLNEEAQGAMQASVDAYYRMFVDAVARHRGVKPEAVRNGYGEGRTVVAAEAVRVGLADRVGTFDSVLSGLGVSSSPATAPRTEISEPGSIQARQREMEILRLRAR